MNRSSSYPISTTTTKTTLSSLLLVFIATCDDVVGGAIDLYFYYSTTNLPVRNYSVTDGNPLKGLAATFWSLEMPVLDFALEYNYVPYDTIVVDYINGQNIYNWNNMETILNQTVNRFRQMVPRVFISYPPSNPSLPFNLYQIVEMRYYPDYGGGYSPYYGDTNLLTSMQQFIFDYAAKYDGDPRIGYIQTGLIGFFGECHTLEHPFLPDATIRQVLGWYREAFVTTKMMTRYPSSWAKENRFGYHDDSWTYSTLDGIADGGTNMSWYYWPDIIAKNNTDVWTYAPLSGETRPENVKIVLTQHYPAGTFTKQDFWLCATTTHTIYMKHGYFGDAYSLSKGKFIHTTMGYNYQIRSIAASANNAMNNAMLSINLAITIQQIGYTPFYYPLYVNVTCPGMNIPRTASGVEQLIDQYDANMFIVWGLPARESCLNAVQINLTSPFIPSYRPMKWAQGTGAITVSIPLPPPTPPIPTTIPPVAVIIPKPTPAPPVNVIIRKPLTNPSVPPPRPTMPVTIIVPPPRPSVPVTIVPPIAPPLLPGPMSVPIRHHHLFYNFFHSILKRHKRLPT